METFFLNRVGHGIGFSVHEGPYIRGGNKQVIQAGMCFSIEPGIYMPEKFGLRIEDIVVAEKNGAQVLNSFERGLTVL